jgi:hypothetical protein
VPSSLKTCVIPSFFPMIAAISVLARSDLTS